MITFKSKFLAILVVILFVGNLFALYKNDSVLEDWLNLMGKYVNENGEHFYLRENGNHLELLYSGKIPNDREKIQFNDFEYSIIPLEEIGNDSFVFQENPYGVSQINFERDLHERGILCYLDKVQYERKFFGPEVGEKFMIKPVRTLDELVKEAHEATPPTQSGTFFETDLVEVTTLDSSIKLDIRYATTNNFMGIPLYSQPRAFLQRPAAEALVRASKKFREAGYGLIIHDAYRPWYVTRMFWDATPWNLRNFVANPDYGSKHNRGCAIDVSLYEIDTGKRLDFGSGYDEFSERAYPEYPGGSSVQRNNRELLKNTLLEEGFLPFKYEWWHFDYHTWRNYKIINISFEELD